MSKLLIIGNGFDLNLQVPSKFEDYFNSVLNDNSEIKFIIERIKSYKLLSRSSDEKVYFDNYDKLKTDFNELYMYNDVNLWFLILYFNLNNNYNQNWSDIESTIYSFLIINRTVIDLKSAIYKVIFKERFDSSLITDLEVYSYFLHFKYKSLNNSNYNVYEYLMMELKEFENSFVKYLNKVVKGSEYYKKSNELFSKLVDKNEDFNVLNFNYTNPEKYNNKSRLKYITNVHGSLKKNNIIIGIDYKELNIDSNLKLDAFSFTKTSRKIHNITNNVSTLFNTLLDKTFDEVIVFGHSLSQADYSYYQSIFDFYDLYHSNIKLCFKYCVYDPKLNNQIKSELSNRVIKLILDYGSTLDNKDHGKNLLHKLMLENRLIIELVK